MDYQLESTIFAIFDEPLSASATAKERQAALDKANRTEVEFFNRAELAYLSGHAGQRTTPPPPIPEELRDVGVGPSEPAEHTIAKLERPLIIGDKYGRAARALIARETGRVRKTHAGEEISVETGLRAAWSQFSEFATGEQKSVAETAIKQVDSAVIQALLRECMAQSESEL